VLRRDFVERNTLLLVSCSNRIRTARPNDFNNFKASAFYERQTRNYGETRPTVDVIGASKCRSRIISVVCVYTRSFFQRKYLSRQNFVKYRTFKKDYTYAITLNCTVFFAAREDIFIDFESCLKRKTV